jgi:hypothetical protein
MPKAAPPASKASLRAAAKAAKPPARKTRSAAAPAVLDDESLLELVQRQTFQFFWEGGHPVSGLAYDRRTTTDEAADDGVIAVGGSGFGVMCIIVAVERGWISRQAGLERLGKMLDVLLRAPCYHGALSHFMNGRTGATINFGRKDDGGDIVETSFVAMGLLCARQYFDRDTEAERGLRGRIDWFWRDIEWNWYTQGDRRLLYWHWSPNNGWVMDHEIRGWNECLITYVLAASSPRYAIEPIAYHRGWAGGRDFLNGKTYYDTLLPLGPTLGGPLFFSHYSFMGLDPRGLKDRYADYWQQNTAQVAVNRDYCIDNPHGFKGYGPDCWGLTASDDPKGYDAHAPDNDDGTISPTAALASFPYAPDASMRALRHFMALDRGRLWQRYGFIDAFCEQLGWYSDTFLAIDQGPIVVMIENFRTGLLWKLFMSVPEVQTGLRRLDFKSPWLDAPAGA